MKNPSVYGSYSQKFYNNSSYLHDKDNLTCFSKSYIIDIILEVTYDITFKSLPSIL
ncbi:hypothetical protein CDLVIII_2144 [Clostridium sp. DL-VIII]|nr:hypothetical protein CDLVIII_2144 [Clostridium sp. DL-VIII]